MNRCRYGDDWELRVLGRSDRRAYTAQHVCWQMAANIYGLMELDTDNQKLYRQVGAAEDHESRLRRHNYSPLFGYRNCHYSSELCDLVEDCLNIRPSNRPKALELVKRTGKGLEKYQKEWDRHRRYDKLHLPSD
jgi:hypothetical protein